MNVLVEAVVKGSSDMSTSMGMKKPGIRYLRSALRDTSSNPFAKVFEQTNDYSNGVLKKFSESEDLGIKHSSICLCSKHESQSI